MTGKWDRSDIPRGETVRLARRPVTPPSKPNPPATELMLTPIFLRGIVPHSIYNSTSYEESSVSGSSSNDG